MSDSPLVTYTQLSPHDRGRRTHAIDRITPHCVVGQCSIEALGDEFSGTKVKSSNYGIDKDGRIGLFVPENHRAVTSSNSVNDNRAVTIECASDTTAPCAFRDVVYQRLIQLCIDICRRNGKRYLLWLSDAKTALAYAPRDDEMVLTCHRWFAATGCPGDWLMSRMGDLADRVTAALNSPTEGGDGMTEYDDGEGGVIVEPSGPGTASAPWYAGAMDWAERSGLIRDGRPNDPVTRAELATVLQRLCEGKEIVHDPDYNRPSGLISD